MNRSSSTPQPSCPAHAVKNSMFEWAPTEREFVPAAYRAEAPLAKHQGPSSCRLQATPPLPRLRHLAPRARRRELRAARLLSVSSSSLVSTVCSLHCRPAVAP